MKSITIVILAVLIAQSVYGASEQKKVTTYFNNYGSIFRTGPGECVEVRERLERNENGDVTIHVEKTSDASCLPQWLLYLRNILQGSPSSIVTVGPRNKVDLELQVKAHTPQAQEILNNVVTNQAEIMRCLRTSPTTTQDVDACIDLYCKVWQKIRSSDCPAGSVSPEQYKEFVNKRWNSFAELVNNVDICAQKESDQIASVKMSGEINTKAVEALAHSPLPVLYAAAMQKRGELADSRNLLKQHAYIDLPGIIHATCAKEDWDTPHVSVRVTKLDVTNMQPVKAFTYKKPAMK